MVDAKLSGQMRARAVMEAAEAFLDRPGRLICRDAQARSVATKPELYRPSVVKRRFTPVLADLPMEFFERVTKHRDLVILVTPRQPNPAAKLNVESHGSLTLRGIAVFSGCTEGDFD
jgi:hypothetical protein